MVGSPAARRGEGVSRGAARRSRAYFSPVANTVSASLVRRDGIRDRGVLL